jgi:acyl carrier protein
MTVTAELEAFIVDEIELGCGIRSIAPDDDLLARGILDSLGVMRLVEFVEDRYGLRVTDEDLVPANFRSLARIGDYIARSRP